MELTLIRNRANSDESGTFGQLTLAGKTYFTVEQPWRNNEVGHSCVPVGVYQVIPHVSPKYGECYALENKALGIARYPTTGVPRALILIHPANVAPQLQGCIAPGTGMATLGYQGKILPSVTNSKVACQQIAAVLGRAIVHQLRIEWDKP